MRTASIRAAVARVAVARVAVLRVAVRRVAVALGACAALGAGACVASVDYTGTEYRCADGLTCPSGFTCVDQTCRPGDGPGDIDAATPLADAGPVLGELIPVAAGAFTMGCVLAMEPNCPLDSIPSRTVMLSAYAIDRTEVTQRAYAACVEAGVCPMPTMAFDPAGKGTHPVHGVSWDDAVKYCTWIGRRLPTEAEWERAARGIDGRTYPWGADAPLCARVNYSACTGTTEPVGAHADNMSPTGAMDMAGNVAEWVADRYSSTYYSLGPDVDPPGPGAGNERVQRGGGFTSPSGTLRTWARAHVAPGTLAAGTGFRCAE